MSWLKVAAEDNAENIMAIMLDALKSVDPSDVKSSARVKVQNAILAADEFLSKKEGSVFDASDYAREDMYSGNLDSGEFDPEHVDDKKKDYSTDPGPASTVPGMNTPVGPGIPTGIV